MTRGAAYARLLRWYPASWRRTHGDVVLGTMLDAAEAEGRDAPTPAERRDAMIDGLAHRLTRRVAIVAAVIAVSCAAAAAALMLGWSGSYAVTNAEAAQVLELLSLLSYVGTVLVAAAPAFAIVSFVATARVRGMRSGVALLAAVVGACAAVALAVAMLSWSVGFHEADAGVVRSPLAASFVVLTAIAWALGAVTAMLLLGEPLHRARRGARRAWAYPVAFAAGVAGWPFVAYAMLTPTTAVLLAVGALLAAVLATRPATAVSTPGAVGSAAASPNMGATTAVDAATARTRRRVIALLAAISAIGGFAAIVFTAAGPMWTALDATQAMRVGIGAGLIAALPLVWCVGLRGAHPLHRWGPPALITLGMLVLAFENLFGSGGEGFFPVLLIAAALAAGGIAWLVGTVDRFGGARLVLAVSAGIVVLALSALLQMLPFALPFAAAVVAVIALARGRRARPPASGAQIVSI